MDNRRIVLTGKTALTASSVLVILALQACGSSGSDNESSSAPFSDPTDGSALQAAMVTGSSAGDDSEFWQCESSASSITFVYHLYADNTGHESDLDNPDAQYSLTWQTLSATSMSTTMDLNGVHTVLTDIQFTGSDQVSLLSNGSHTLNCERMSSQTDETPTGTSGPLTYGGSSYELTHGFEETFSYRPVQSGDTHSVAEFQVADASFSQTTLLVSGSPIIIWRPNDASVWFRADLHSPGGDGVASATFDYVSDAVDEDGPLVADKHFFNEGRFGVDLNNDGDIDSDDNEFLDITGGSITLNRLDTSALTNVLQFNVTLSNGVPISGSFEGQFPVYAH